MNDIEDSLGRDLNLYAHRSYLHKQNKMLMRLHISHFVLGAGCASRRRAAEANIAGNTSWMQLVTTVSTDLNLPTRVSPPYSHQSQGKVERFHRKLFDPLRTTRLQWSKGLKVEPHMPASRVTSMGASTQHLHSQQLPRSFIRQDITLRELLLQLPLQHRWLWRDCPWGHPQHPDSEATSQESTSEGSGHLDTT